MCLNANRFIGQFKESGVSWKSYTKGNCETTMAVNYKL